MGSLWFYVFAGFSVFSCLMVLIFIMAASQLDDEVGKRNAITDWDRRQARKERLRRLGIIQ